MLALELFDRNVPADLKNLANWIAFGPDPGSGRPKCPLKISNRQRRASTRRPETWTDWRSARAFYSKHGDGQKWGVGFVFTPEAKLVYVDLDDALTPEGQMREWAEPFIRPFAGRAYMERSPSGRGLHIITRGTLPGGATGGTAKFPSAATGLAGADGRPRVPEVAMFSAFKYTTLTGDVWKKQATIGEGTEAAAQVWESAGIAAAKYDAGAGPAPKPEHLPKPGKVPSSVKRELKECSAADAEDRSAARFGFYCEAMRGGLGPEELFALVLESDWYGSSGASEKGPDHTWADIIRAYAKAEDLRAQFAEVEEQRGEEQKQAQMSWKDLGLPVTVRMTKGGPVVEVVQGVQAMAITLERHPEWAGRLRRNGLKETIELDGEPLEEYRWPEIAERLRSYLMWPSEPAKNGVWEAITLAAEALRYHPVAEYLRALRWDGVGRISDWLVRAGCEDSAVTRVVGRKWIISLAARALRPGCKSDCVLVLEGDQGYRKSSLFEALAGGPEFFTDSSVQLDKDGLMVMSGHWIVEAAELASFKKAETETIKAFLSRKVDTFRPPYGRTTLSKPRHFVIVGSTNDDEYLTDTTGNRRYWPVSVPKGVMLDVDLVRTERDQLLAEAVAALEAGEPWWFETQPRELTEAQASRLAADPLEGRLDLALEQSERPVHVPALLEMMGLPCDRKDLAMRLGKLLRARGFFRVKVWAGNSAKWVWREVGMGDEPSENQNVISLTTLTHLHNGTGAGAKSEEKWLEVLD